MIPVVARLVREIPTHLVDDPDNPMRETFEDEEFYELCADIQRNGIQIPLIVEPRGDRFQVIAGHRRIVAARRCEAATVPCDVRESSAIDGEAIKVLENDVREKVNAAEAGAYLWRLFNGRCECDVDKVCALIRRSRQYVEDRLAVVQGDPDVLDALKAKRISLGVAKELNLIVDVGYRRLHLLNALKVGMTIDAAKDARKEANATIERSKAAAERSGGVPEVAIDPTPAPNACIVCHKHDRLERMHTVVIHDYCELGVLDQALAPFRATIAGDPSA